MVMSLPFGFKGLNTDVAQYECCENEFRVSLLQTWKKARQIGHPSVVMVPQSPAR
jgi:hypothetical protein